MTAHADLADARSATCCGASRAITAAPEVDASGEITSYLAQVNQSDLAFARDSARETRRCGSRGRS